MSREGASWNRLGGESSVGKQERFAWKINLIACWDVVLRVVRSLNSCREKSIFILRVRGDTENSSNSYYGNNRAVKNIFSGP